MAGKQKNFEQALHELETIIAALERDDLSLDEALAHFESGIGLMRTCDEHLKSAEGKLRELLKGENGEYAERILGSMADMLCDEGAPDE